MEPTRVTPKHIRHCLLGLSDQEDVPFLHVTPSSSMRAVREWLSSGTAPSSSSAGNVPSAGDLAETLLFSDMTPKRRIPSEQNSRLLLLLANTVLYDAGALVFENKLSSYSAEAFFPAVQSQAEQAVYQSLVSTLADKTMITARPSAQAVSSRDEFSLFDMRPLLPPCQHQGLSSDCTAHAVQSALVAARAAQLFERDSSLSEKEVQTELSASLPSRAYISAMYKQVFGPALPNINMLTQWTYGIADSAMCSASMGVPLESHFNYPALYQLAYRSSKVTEEQLDEFSQKLLGETSPFLAQLAERGPYAGWTVAPVVFPNEVSTFRKGILGITSVGRDTASKARERVVLMEQFLAALQPILLSFPVYSSFQPFSSPVYHPPGRTDTYQGFNHSVCIVGYDRDRAWFIVRDNYGEDLGEEGYWYLPYSTLEWFQTGPAPWVGRGMCTLVPPRSARDSSLLK